MDRDRRLEAFLTAIDGAAVCFGRPSCRGWLGDYQITGKCGHVLADAPGYWLYVTGTVRRWKKAKRLLPGVVTQDGDDEGIIRLDRLPTRAEGGVIRELLGIRKRPAMTPEWRARLKAAGDKTAFPRPPVR